MGFVLCHIGNKLFQLQFDKPSLGSEFNKVFFHLRCNPHNHFGFLYNSNNVGQGCHILIFEGRKARFGPVQHCLVFLEGLGSLVRL